MVEAREAFAVIVAGPSGSGKTTLARRAVERDDKLRFSVSDTSRPRRGKEVEGRDYRFRTEAEFEKRIEEGAYAEWARVHGDYYGTPRSEIDGAASDGVNLLLDIDVQGAEQVRAAYGSAVAIFIVPPSWEVLERRLRNRGTDSEERIRTRLRNAEVELEKKFSYDYIVVNDDLEAALDAFLSIIRAERCRAERLTESAAS